MTLAECGAPATLPADRQVDLEPGRFQHFYRGNPDVRLMIPNERIVPEHHTPAGGRMVSLGMVREPAAERLPCVVREGALRVDAKRAGQQLAKYG